MPDKDTKLRSLIDESLEKNAFSDLITQALSGSEIQAKAATTSPYIWLAQGLIENRGFHALFARAKQGKSIVAAYLADAISKGKDFNSYCRNEHHKPVKTLYIDWEVEEVEWQQRYGKDFLQKLQMKVLYADAMATYEEQFSEDPEKLIDFLRAAAEEGYEFIVLDSLSYSAINISDPKQATRYKLALNRLAKELLAEGKNVSFLFVAHMTKAIKNKNGKISFELMQGASDWSQLYRNLIGVGSRSDIGEEENGIYLKADGRSKRPDSIGSRCIPLIKTDTASGAVALVVEEPRYEDELIEPSGIIDSSKKDIVRVTLLAILEASRVVNSAQSVVAQWTGTQQGHISRAKKLQQIAYEQAREDCREPSKVVDYWQAIKDEIDYGLALPENFEKWLQHQRETASQQNLL